jgi:hypothetical protein
VKVEHVLAALDLPAPKPKGRAKRAAERDGDLEGEQQRKKKRPDDNTDDAAGDKEAREDMEVWAYLQRCVKRMIQDYKIHMHLH